MIKMLKLNDIDVGVSISPFFIGITNYKEIIEKTKEYANFYRFEFLKLTGESKREILKYIGEKYPMYYLEYAKIYLMNDDNYLKKIKEEIERYCKSKKVNYYFEKKS